MKLRTDNFQLWFNWRGFMLWGIGRWRFYRAVIWRPYKYEEA